MKYIFNLSYARYSENPCIYSEEFSFEGPEDSIQYAFEDEIPVGIYKDLKICISDLLNN